MSNNNIANEQIKSYFVFLITDDGHKYGKMQTQQAIKMAKEKGLDLIQVSAGTLNQPPVAKMVDLGKVKYKQAKQQKHNNHHSENKEIRFYINISPHDLETKNNKVIELLTKKCKVRYVLELYNKKNKYRQPIPLSDAISRMKELLEKFSSVASFSAPTVNEGKSISSNLTPKSNVD